MLTKILDFLKSIPADRSEVAALLTVVNDTVVLANALGAHITPQVQQALLAELTAVTLLAGAYLIHRGGKAA